MHDQKLAAWCKKNVATLPTPQHHTNTNTNTTQSRIHPQLKTLVARSLALGHGMQDAKKGVIFEAFPPVLNIQLRRFEYDMYRDESYKVHDKFEFPDRMNLDKFLIKRDAGDATCFGPFLPTRRLSAPVHDVTTVF
jgi:hypothetical protein